MSRAAIAMRGLTARFRWGSLLRWRRLLFGGAGSGDSSQLSWLENDLDGAFAKAREKSGKVLVDFTGDACRWRLLIALMQRPPYA
jgi:hypothetical protein